MAVVSAVVFYGQQNLSRFNKMAEYWRRSMLPEERERLFILSAAGAHLSFDDPSTAEVFRERCWKLKRPDVISGALIERMLERISHEGIQLHIVCGGESTQDPLAPLRLVTELRRRVQPVVVSVFFYMMLEDAPAAQHAQRQLAEKLAASNTSCTVYLLSRRDAIGRLLPRFDMDRALTCEILLRHRSLRMTQVNHVYTLGYKSLNAFDSELAALRKLALRNAAREQHDTPMHNVDAWKILFPDGKGWTRFFTVSEAWREMNVAKEYASNLDAWHGTVQCSTQLERFQDVPAPNFSSGADVRETVNRYLMQVAGMWVRQPDAAMLNNARILYGLNGKDGADRVMECIKRFIQLNSPMTRLQQHCETFAQLLVRQFEENLCSRFNAAEFPENSVLTLVIQALEQLEGERFMEPGTQDSKLSLGAKVLPGLFNWDKYYQEQCKEAASRYVDYQQRKLVQKLAGILKQEFRTGAKVFLQQLKRSDDFQRALNRLRDPSGMDESLLQDKYNGYWRDVELTLSNRANTRAWPYGPYAGGNDERYQEFIYDRDAVLGLIAYRKELEAGRQPDTGVQEKWLDQSGVHLQEYLDKMITKESRTLHEEQHAGYSSTFIRALNTMNPSETNMDNFLRLYLNASTKMLCMIHAQDMTAISRNYFVDDGLGDCDWMKEHRKEAITLSNDNIERLDLYPVQENLAALLAMPDNMAFGMPGQAPDEDDDEQFTDDRRADSPQEDEDEHWVMETSSSNSARMRTNTDESDDALTQTADLALREITFVKKGMSIVAYWPDPNKPEYDMARVMVKPRGEARNVQKVAWYDVTNLLTAGVNEVTVSYAGELYARGTVTTGQRTVTYSMKHDARKGGLVLKVNVPGDATFVLRDEGRRILYPLRATDKGIYEGIKLIGRGVLDEIPKNPQTGKKYILQEDKG